MKYKSIIVKSLLLFPLLASSCMKSVDNNVDLSGSWSFSTDSLDWNTSIKLPGSMASNGLGEDISVTTDWTGGIVDSSYFKSDAYAAYREKGNIKVPFWLQPVKYYKGVAWYKREIEIPSDWKEQSVELFLERCHWETHVWLDGMDLGMQNALGAPHRYLIPSSIAPGKHTLLIRVDNRVKDIDPGENSHSITDHTQGNWNGIVGEIALKATPKVHVESMEIYPELESGKVLVKAHVVNDKDAQVNAALTVSVDGVEGNTTFSAAPGNQVVEASVTLPSVEAWDEFHPNLYALKLTLKDSDAQTEHVLNQDFGFRHIKNEKGLLTLNGRRIFLRGTLDCAAFPKTGFPPTDVDSWKREFEICKNHGLNHVRFHSWCPPEAAFVAADQLGLYLEIECSSWANQSTTIGDGGPLDAFIQKESEAIVKEFGNHPSFCMMMYGNEPAGAGSNKYLENFVTNWQKKDARRMYSTAAGWPNLPCSDFLSDPAPRVQRWGEGLNSIINAKAPNSLYDWSEYVSRYPEQPMVSHEIGQWCVYPNRQEMVKYDGVMQPKNFEIFFESLEKNGLVHLADSFKLASGKLQTLCYKADIEAALKTRNFGGFQLLGLSDFPGQGTALVGVLDAFWDEKGYVTPDEFRSFCNQTVPLVRLPKFIYTNNELIEGSVELAHFGEKPIPAGKAEWTLKTTAGKVVKSGSLNHAEMPVGNCLPLGELKIALSDIQQPEQLVLTVSVGQFANHWNFWCYPVFAEKASESKVLMVDKLDAKAMAALNAGEKVLLSLRKQTLSSDMGGDIQIGFSSIFWNTAWTLGQAPHTLGILCDPKHQALKEFPTAYHSDYQWWDAMSHSGAIEYAKVASDIQPIVRVIDDWFTNRPLALLFEVKVGKGNLLVSGIDFWNDMDHRTEARQLLHSLTEYMNSNAFSPKVAVDVAAISKMIK